MSTSSSNVDTEILIKVLTAFQSGGMDAAIACVNQLGKAADKTSKDGDKLAALMDLLTNKSADAKTIFAGLSQTLHGGMGAVKGFGTAVNGLASAFGAATGPIGLVITAVQLGVTAWMAYANHQEAAARAAAEAAERQKAAAEKAKQAIEDLNKARVDAARAAVAALKEELDGATTAAKSARSALDALEDSQLGIEIANIDAQVKTGQLDSETADYLKTKARTEYADRKDQRALDDLRAEENRLTAARNQSATAATDARTRSEKADAAFQSASAELDKASKALAAFETAHPDFANGAIPGSSFGPPRPGDFELIRERKRLAEAQATAQERHDTARADAETAATDLHIADAVAKAAADALASANIENRRSILVNGLSARQIAMAAAESVMQARIDAIPEQVETSRDEEKTTRPSKSTRPGTVKASSNQWARIGTFAGNGTQAEALNLQRGSFNALKAIQTTSNHIHTLLRRPAAAVTL